MERTLSILVVDDEQVVLDAIGKHLRKENVELHTALSAQEGLNLMDTTQVDIVLTDLMMPEIDGLEMVKIIKGKFPRTPVIMITGYATINTALKATQLGAFDYLAKPFTKTELLSVIHRAAELVQAAESLKDDGSVEQSAEASPPPVSKSIKTIGENVWMMLEDDGTVILGVKHSYLHTIGKIQHIYLPSQGDELRQGSVYLQIISSDLRSHTILSPLTGMVTGVNEQVVENPSSLIEDPYGEGWLIRLKPSRFEIEIQSLGL